ncbi:MAG: Gfo/Idh/MocA family oxidoreductase, partial [Planctomycetota bacterium]
MRAKRKIRWGILGTGAIARKFAEGLKLLPDAELLAVGSRAARTAEKFADSFQIPHWYAGYDKLANDSKVDVIYVATPHPLHMENTLMCLNAGRAVLCEKPFAVNASQATRMVNTARNKRLFLMEAMWNRFLPVMVKVRRLLDQKVIGEVRLLQADFGFRGKWNPKGRLFNPELAGGALLDVGVYTVSFASMVFKKPPKKISAMAHIGKTGVDEQSAMLFGYDNGQLAVLSCAVRTDTPQQAFIMGTKGTISIYPHFWRTTSATISVKGRKDRVLEVPLEGYGLDHQAREVMRCLRAGKLESEVMPLDESIQIMKTMDKIR